MDGVTSWSLIFLISTNLKGIELTVVLNRGREDIANITTVLFTIAVQIEGVTKNPPSKAAKHKSSVSSTILAHTANRGTRHTRIQ